MDLLENDLHKFLNSRQFISPRDKEKIKQIKLRLNQKNIKATWQRIFIFHFLFESGNNFHFFAGHLTNYLKQKGVNLSTATIYNTLNLFIKHGFLKEVQGNSNSKIYDTCTETHIHFFIKTEGKVADYAMADFNANVELNLKDPIPKGYKIEDVQVNIIVSKDDSSN